MNERYEITMSAIPRGKLRVIHADGGFGKLPTKVRHRGPWTGSKSGAVLMLKPEYRLALARDGYVIVEGVDWDWTPEVGGKELAKTPMK